MTWSFKHSYLENPMDRRAWWIQSMRSQRVGHDLAPYTHCCWPTWGRRRSSGKRQNRGEHTWRRHPSRGNSMCKGPGEAVLGEVMAGRGCSRASRGREFGLSEMGASGRSQAKERQDPVAVQPHAHQTGGQTGLRFPCLLSSGIQGRSGPWGQSLLVVGRKGCLKAACSE